MDDTTRIIAILVIGLVIAKRIAFGPQRQFAALSGGLMVVSVAMILSAPNKTSWMIDFGAISLLAGLSVALIMKLVEGYFYFSKVYKKQ